MSSIIGLWQFPRLECFTLGSSIRRRLASTLSKHGKEMFALGWWAIIVTPYPLAGQRGTFQNKPRGFLVLAIRTSTRI